MTLYDFLSGAVALGFLCLRAVLPALLAPNARRRCSSPLHWRSALLGLGQTILALANIPTEERGSIFLDPARRIRDHHCSRSSARIAAPSA